MKKTYARNLLALAALGAVSSMMVACGSSDNPPVATADAVYINGKVVTVDKQSTIAQAFAIKDGKFLAAGTTEQIQRLVGADTKTVDLKQHTVIPGLTDSHLHSAGGGPGVDLSKVRSLAELFAKVKERADQVSPNTVVVSNSDWHEAQLAEQRLPTAAELEVAAPGVPVVLVRGGHSYFLNNTALAHYGITVDTPVPAGGAIPKGPDGKLTGEVTDAAKALVTLPPKPPTTIDDLVAQQKILNSYGLTSVRIPGTSVAAYRQFQQLRDEGKATVRYSILFRPKGLEDFQTSIVDAGIKQGEGDEWVKTWGIKISVDGGFEGGLMTEPYLVDMGTGTQYYGLQIIPQEPFNKYMHGINQAGWRAAVHAVGDAAVDEVIAGFQEANNDQSITGKGWTIEHAFVTRPDQYPKIKALNLRLSVQDHLYLAAPVLKKYWGWERAAHVTPVKTYLDQGFLLAGGTDAAVVPVSPFWVMYHFLTRDTISDGVYGVDEAVKSRETVLRMMTINNAKLTDEEEIKGSIEPDKLADFVVLSADYMTIPDGEVEDLKALETYVGGKLVYKDADVAL